MRTLRLSLAGTLILALLGGLGSAVVAQDAEAPELPVAVTGTEDCLLAEDGTSAFEAGVFTERAWVSNCENTMSDPRVGGTFRNTFNSDCHGSDCLAWGTHVLDGPSGGWDCRWAGTNDPTGNNFLQVLGVCPGTGEHEGLTYVFQHVVKASGFDGDFGDGSSLHGFIYEGDPPPFELTPMAE